MLITIEETWPKEWLESHICNNQGNCWTNRQYGYTLCHISACFHI